MSNVRRRDYFNTRLKLESLPPNQIIGFNFLKPKKQKTLKNVNKTKQVSNTSLIKHTINYDINSMVKRIKKVCTDRKVRKNVLHAFRKTGKIGQNKPKRNINSRITCK